jgi:hypothetical protein
LHWLESQLQPAKLPQIMSPTAAADAATPYQPISCSRPSEIVVSRVRSSSVGAISSSRKMRPSQCDESAPGFDGSSLSSTPSSVAQPKNERAALRELLRITLLIVLPAGPAPHTVCVSTVSASGRGWPVLGLMKLAKSDDDMPKTCRNSCMRVTRRLSESTRAGPMLTWPITGRPSLPTRQLTAHAISVAPSVGQAVRNTTKSLDVCPPVWYSSGIGTPPYAPHTPLGARKLVIRRTLRMS